MQFTNGFIQGLDGNLDLPAHGTMQARYLQGLKSLIHDRGGDPRRVLERHNIDPLPFENPDYHIESAAAVNLLEYCSRSFQDTLFGLHLAEQQDPDVFGSAIVLARAAPTLRLALQSLVDYLPLGTPDCELELATTKEIVELRWRTDSGFGESEQANYQGLLLIMKTFLQMLGREHFRPSYANLTFKIRQSDLHELQDRLRCRVNGRSESHAIALSSDILDRPLPTSNRILYNLLGAYLAHLRAASKFDFVEQVEAYIRGALPTGTCSVGSCAERLRTSVRTLQKRLTRMDVKFSDIVQSQRIKLAKHALLWSDCTLDEIAFQLGYSEQTSFGRAFKRSTGLTPQAFRLSADGKHALRASDRGGPVESQIS